jgi:hypothetical protein
MDNIEISNSGEKKPDEPISFDTEEGGGASVSHSPLNLGGPAAAEVSEVEVTAQPAQPVEKRPVEQKPAEKTAGGERITGVKTFFTRLHAGAIEFLDGQITKWLKDNPDISVKQTNTTVGEIQGKKTEPNIIITIWY